MRIERVALLVLELVGNEGQGAQLLVGDLDALEIPVEVLVGRNAESGARRRGRDQVDDGAHGGEWPTAPVDGDETEEPVLDRVSFRGPRRVAADRDVETDFFGQNSQFDLSCSDPVAVGPAGASSGPAGSRDTKTTHDHRENTKSRSMSVNSGEWRTPCFACSRSMSNLDVDLRIVASAASIPATSTMNRPLTGYFALISGLFRAT